MQVLNVLHDMGSVFVAFRIHRCIHVSLDNFGDSNDDTIFRFSCKPKNQ